MSSFEEFDPEIYDDHFYHAHTTQIFEFEYLFGKSLVTDLGYKRILDLGCGIGRWISGSIDAGAENVLGFEYNMERAAPHIPENIKEYVEFKDLRKQITPNDIRNIEYDCVICVEVAEHIDIPNTDNFLDNVCTLTNDTLIFTSAPPGQAGHGHINMGVKDEWRNMIESRGLNFNQNKMEEVVAAWEKYCKIPDYIHRNLAVYTKG